MSDDEIETRIWAQKGIKRKMSEDQTRILMQKGIKRRRTLQVRMKASTPEKGSTYAKVDTWKVDMWKNAKRGYMNEKDMGMTLTQPTNQEG